MVGCIAFQHNWSWIIKDCARIYYKIISCRTLSIKIKIYFAVPTLMAIITIRTIEINSNHSTTHVASYYFIVKLLNFWVLSHSTTTSMMSAKLIEIFRLLSLEYDFFFRLCIYIDSELMLMVNLNSDLPNTRF